jgi:ParB family transcriptional regulator, chromosome partitioning protein
MAKKQFTRMDASDYRAPGIETLTVSEAEKPAEGDTSTKVELAGGSNLALADAILSSTLREHAEIPLDRLYPNPRQPRKVFDDQKIEELAKDIEANGLIEEIVVRVKQGELNTWETICGERRSRACRLLGWKTIPAQIRVATEAEMLRIALAENDQHEELTPYDLAVAYNDLRTDLNKAEERDIPLREFAEQVVHRNKDVVQLHFNLLKCEPPLLAWAREDPTVPLRIIDELRRIEDGQARTELMQLIRAKIFNQDEVIALARKLREEALRTKQSGQKEARKEPGPEPTDPIIRLALRTKEIAGDHKKVSSIITRYRQDMTTMFEEEKSLLQKQIATWIGELQKLLDA